MWRELIRELCKDFEPVAHLDPGPEFFPGATPAELEAVERQLGVPLPPSLKELLDESNGVLVCFGQHLIWSTDEMVSRNIELRTDPIYADDMPLDHLLFFGDAGVDGIQFAFPISRNGLVGHHIFAWDHMEDGRQWKARSLRAYVEGWLTGKLTV
ncbi:MAG TPA: SMI1/KNR4 family protein [Ktedonobacterales bacterium]|nr:SMI1/KNR4 family protein [Ktedonobacterales bacterium]